MLIRVRAPREGEAHLEGSGDGGVQTTTSSIDLSYFYNELKVIFSLPALIKLVKYFWGKHCVKSDYWKSVPQQCPGYKQDLSLY